MCKGMGWVDTHNSKALTDMVREAVAAYEVKNGCKPKLVQANPGVVHKEVHIDGVKVVPSGKMAYPSWLFLVDPETDERSSLDE